MSEFEALLRNGIHMPYPDRQADFTEEGVRYKITHGSRPLSERRWHEEFVWVEFQSHRGAAVRCEFGAWGSGSPFLLKAVRIDDQTIDIERDGRLLDQETQDALAAYLKPVIEYFADRVAARRQEHNRTREAELRAREERARRTTRDKL